MPPTKSKNATWPIVPLASEVKFLSGGTPTMSESKYWNGDIPWVSSGEMNQRKIHDTSQRVTEEGAMEGSKRVPARTVLAVVRGMSLAKEFRVAITARDVTFNQDLKALIPTDRLFPEFLFYYLLSQNQPIRDSASESAHGTKKLDTQVLEEWPLPLPLVQTQQKIAAVLSAYDELIENNRRRIALLEKLAEEIYREWFVRLRFPGHEKVKLLKGVPEGWKDQPASEVLHVMGGGTPKTEVPAYWDGDIPFFTPKDSHVGFYVLDTEKKLTVSGLESCSSQLFPVETMFITARGTVGELCLAHQPMAMNQSCYALAPKNAQSVFFHFLAMKTAIAYIKGISKSGVFDNIVIDTFKQVPIRMPGEGLVNQFNKIAEPIFRQVGALLEMNVQLRQTRDLLLPRLISGKLSVEHQDIQFPPGMAEEELAAS